MKSLDAYLEVSDDGRWMAHVPALPGCMARAHTRQEVLGSIRQAVAEYRAWLARHGESVTWAGQERDIEVVGQFSKIGPFDPGDAAALLPPDREPVSLEEMVWHFRLMGYAREDLVALMQDLPEDVLDWRPYPESYSARRVLRHIGNADEWYVSRIVPQETLPAEWADDEAMPLDEFLEMSRRTAIARLQRLTDAERSLVVYPTHHTVHPQEGWTVRKVLRRFLEHEREHTAQLRGILAARKRWLLARLAQDRASLAARLLRLDAASLTSVPMLGTWTVKDILAHIAGWDRWEASTMQAMLEDKEPSWEAAQDVDQANERFVSARHARTLDEVISEWAAAREEWVGWLESLPEEELYRARSVEGYDWTFGTVALRVHWEHDAEHARQIAGWRATEGFTRASGPKRVLRTGLEAARCELEAVAALLPGTQRATRPVCGAWTLQDLLGHIADWEWFGAQGVRLMAQGQIPNLEEVADIDAWNASCVAARRGQTWSQVWADLQAARDALLSELTAISEETLGSVHPFPGGARGTPYEWLVAFHEHERSHAHDLRNVILEM